jgi:hypothetical protein
MSSTITVQSVINFSSAHTELMPLANVAGFTDEPALSLANDVLGEIMSPPFAWKFNRATMPLLLTSQNRQDYKFAGAAVFTLKGASVIGGVGIDLVSNNGITESGFTVTVKTLDPHNLTAGDPFFMTGNTVAAYNSVETITPTSSQWSNGWTVLAVIDAKTFTFTHASSGLANSGAPGITDFGWAEYATFVDELSTSSPRQVRHLEATRTLQPSSQVATPEQISITESGTAGILSVRFNTVPSAAAFGVSVVYQKKAPVLTAIAGATWAPVPDEYAFVVRQMFLASAFRYVGSARGEKEYEKAQLAISKALGRDDAETSNEFIAPEIPLMGWNW